MRIGLVVNPDAGLGGRLGYKGSDGRAAEARASGAQDRSGPRTTQALARLAVLINQRQLRQPLTIVVWAGRMGEAWLPSAEVEGAEKTEGAEKPEGGERGEDGVGAEKPPWQVEVIGEVSEITGAEDTQAAVTAFAKGGVDLLVYAGGDGTSRDIVNALSACEASDVPILGIPGGVKMHSGCFAATPNAAAEVIRAYLDGDLLPGRTEVMDLDEDVYRAGEWRVRMYGEAMTPSSPRWMQGAKEQVLAADESEAIQALAEHVKMLEEANPELLIIWGSGGTLHEMASQCGHSTTLLGIDVTKGPATKEGDTGKATGKAKQDLNEAQLLEHIGQHEGEKLLLLSPMGGQGFLIGRGNLQLSPAVLRAIGLDNILGVVTPAKLLSLAKVRIDSGDAALDAEFQERKYVKLLQGFRTTRIMRIEE